MLVKRYGISYNVCGDFMRYSSADLEKIEKYEYKRGINYIKFGDRSYNRIIAVTFLFWLYMMAMVSLYVLGFYMGIRYYSNMVVGIVVAVNPSEITVDIGRGVTGYISKDEYSSDVNADLVNEVKVNDKLNLMKIDEREGTAILSKRLYDEIVGWDNLENLQYKWTPHYITMLVTTAVTLLTPVLYATFGIIAHHSAPFKLKFLRPFRLALIAINAVTTPILFVQFAMISLNDGVPLSGTTSEITDLSEGFLGLKRLFYLRHGIPMLFVFVLCVVLIWLYLRQRYKMKKVFERITKNEENYKIINDDE